MRNLFLIALLSLAACNAGKPPVAEDKMAAVLVDIHLAEARASQIPADSNGHADMGRNLDSLAVFYQSVLQHHSLDTATFREAMNWYSAHPEQLDSVYKKGVVRLEGIAREP